MNKEILYFLEKQGVNGIKKLFDDFIKNRNADNDTEYYLICNGVEVGNQFAFTSSKGENVGHNDEPIEVFSVNELTNIKILEERISLLKKRIAFTIKMDDFKKKLWSNI